MFPQVEKDDKEPDVLTLRYTGVTEGFSTDIMAMADLHWDNPLCDRQLLTDHLDYAKEKQIPVFVVGDLFCFMQGKGDPRGTKEGVRLEHNVDYYIDAVQESAANYFQHYSDVIVAISPGNHDTAMIKHHEINPTRTLNRRLGTHYMGYSGYYRVMFSDKGNRGRRTTRNIWYHHGYGGGGPVTKGVIQSNRRAVYTPDAHVVMTGHIHESWILEIRRSRISTRGRTSIDTQYHLQLPTYKDEWTMKGGFHTQLGRTPRPLGCWLIRFYWHPRRLGKIGIKFERMN